MVDTARTFEPTVAPYQFGMLWELAAYGPLAASEFTITRRHNGNARATANSLRPLVALGLVDRTDHGIYSLTPKARWWLQTWWLGDG